uniref:Uncharacterized protein n=1 Tax=Oryza rufipogon TaxID=4529 RepID=A0A0E0QQY0_ORYRU
MGAPVDEATAALVGGEVDGGGGGAVLLGGGAGGGGETEEDAVGGEGVLTNPVAVREEEEERRWSGSLHHGTWSSVTAGSTRPTPGAAATEEAEADAAVSERWIRAASARVSYDKIIFVTMHH